MKRIILEKLTVIFLIMTLVISLMPALTLTVGAADVNMTISGKVVYTNGNPIIITAGNKRNSHLL